MVIIVVVKRSPILKGSFNKAPKCEKSAFLGSLKYALVREVSIFQFLTQKLACFAQSPDLVHTNKQSNKQTDNRLRDKTITLPLLRTCSRGNKSTQILSVGDVHAAHMHSN